MTDSSSASLIGKQGMGGIHGGKGYKAQDAYLCIKLPYWFAEPYCTHVLNEGSGDIDVKYERDGKVERHYLQVKDHLVDRAEFREVVQQFWDKHQADPEITRFVLVSGGLHKDVKAVRLALARLRGAEAMHGGTATEAATVTQLQEKVTDLDLPVTAEWLHEHVDIEDSEHIRTYPNSPRSLLNDFVGQTQSLPGFENTLRPALVQAYESLQAFISNNPGQTLAREDILDVIRRAVDESNRMTQAEGLGIFLDVWGDPNAEARLAHDAVIDWRDHFDRKTRRVSTVKTWAETLLPDLDEVQRRFRDSGTNRRVIVRGNAPLSVGLAVGAAFSAVKGYRLTVEQRGELWASDTPANGTRMVPRTGGMEMLGEGGQSLCVELNGVREVRRKVDEFKRASGTRFAARLALDMETEIENWTAEDAAGVVASVRRHLIDAYDRHGFEELHLFFAMPLGVAVLLGHKLNSVSIVQAYELQREGSYAPSCRLDLG